MLGVLDEASAGAASRALLELCQAQGWKEANLIFSSLRGNSGLQRDARNDEETVRQCAERLREIGFPQVDLIKRIAQTASMHAAHRRAHYEGLEDKEAVQLGQFKTCIHEAAGGPLSPIATAMGDLAMHAAWHAANRRAYYEGGCTEHRHLSDADRDESRMHENKMNILVGIRTEIAVFQIRNDLASLRNEVELLRNEVESLRNEAETWDDAPYVFPDLNGY